ncbi:MAG: hypothetical protein E7231_04475 [Cellulosilyticum sp.]|nr:hypothetical protein [Cellulosilyticum sp.]
MNKKLKVVLAVTLLSGTSLYAADSFVGTKADPLVTKSYVDSKIAQLSGNTGNSNNNDLAAKLEAQEELISVLSQQIAQLEAAQSGFEIVTVPAGSTIFGKQGSEMIIRSGEGTIVASAGGGVQDVTDGVDLLGGTKAPNNNMLIIPRADGRGISANRTMVVMVRGGYTIS